MQHYAIQLHELTSSKLKTVTDADNVCLSLSLFPFKMVDKTVKSKLKKAFFAKLIPQND